MEELFSWYMTNPYFTDLPYTHIAVPTKGLSQDTGLSSSLEDVYVLSGNKFGSIGSYITIYIKVRAEVEVSNVIPLEKKIMNL